MLKKAAIVLPNAATKMQICQTGPRSCRHVEQMCLLVVAQVRQGKTIGVRAICTVRPIVRVATATEAKYAKENDDSCPPVSDEEADLQNRAAVVSARRASVAVLSAQVRRGATIGSQATSTVETIVTVPTATEARTAEQDDDEDPQGTGAEPDLASRDAAVSARKADVAALFVKVKQGKRDHASANESDSEKERPSVYL